MKMHQFHPLPCQRASTLPKAMGKTAGRKSRNDEPEHRNKIIPSSPRGARLREELQTKIVPWEKITVTLDHFPYYIEEQTKSLLIECVASHLKQSKLRKYGARLKSSSQRILLQSIPGTELYRERLVCALACELQVPLLKIDDDCASDDEEDASDGETSAYETDEELFCEEPTQTTLLKKGDRVKYVGSAISFEEVNNRTLSRDQRGEVYEVDGKRVAVVFYICGLKTKKAVEDEENTEILRQALVTWLNVRDVEPDLEVRIHDRYIATEVLYGVVQSQQPVIIYFADGYFWPSKSDYSNKPFLKEVEKIFKQLTEGVVMICAENQWDAGLNEMAQFPETVKKYIDAFEDPRRYKECLTHRLFTNIFYIKPPTDEDLVNRFIKQIEEDRSESNLKTIHKVLKDHNLLCINLEHPNIGDVTLTRQKVEKIVGWATNHYLSSCPIPCVKAEILQIPNESIKLAIARLMEEEKSKKQINQDFSYSLDEERLVSAVVRTRDINVKFDDVGVPENVKKTLYETVILPMRRPELFSHRNLLRPSKGILLFGPPGTGKTLIAKALATESGAKFINFTGDIITSTRSLFIYASKLAPVIIFVDEVDILLGARGQNNNDKHVLNEFMEAWDGIKSNDSQGILVIGATNRPFDLDEAVIRHMPRRIYVGLPDVENRSKILKVLLNKENLESGFSFGELAEATEGYSGSDLKNLCVAAAYRPLEEFLEQESKGEASDGVPAFRPLNLHDFILSKAKVRPSVVPNASSIIKLREWKEQYGEGESQRQQS